MRLTAPVELDLLARREHRFERVVSVHAELLKAGQVVGHVLQDFLRPGIDPWSLRQGDRSRRNRQGGNRKQSCGDPATSTEHSSLPQGLGLRAAR